MIFKNEKSSGTSSVALLSMPCFVAAMVGEVAKELGDEKWLSSVYVKEEDEEDEEDEAEGLGRS